MSNRIDSNPAPLGALAGASRSPRVSTAESARSSATAATAAIVGIDTLRLTGDALQLQRSEQLQRSGASQDSRVARIQQAVAEGRYSIDAQAVANKLLHMDWQLGDGT